MSATPIYTSTEVPETTSSTRRVEGSRREPILAKFAPWRRWLTRHAFMLVACITAVLYAPAPLFNCAILAGFFAAMPERFLLVLLVSGLTAVLFVAQSGPFWTVLTTYAILWLLHKRFLGDRAIAAMLLAGGGLLLWELPNSIQGGGSEIFALLARMSLAAMLGYFYLQILDRLQNNSRLKPNYRLALMVLFIYPMFLGLGNLTVFGLTLRYVIIVACVWLLSFTQDAAWGALAGLLGGLALWFDPFSGFYWSATFGLLAALIGFTSEFGRWTSMLLFASGLIATNGYFIVQGGRGFAAESLVALLILSILPASWLQKMNNQAKVFAYQWQPRFNTHIGERQTLKRLTETGELLGEMALFFQPPIAPGQATDGRCQGIAQLVQERCCKSCPKFSTCLARSYALFEAVAQSKLTPDEMDMHTRGALQQFIEFCFRPEMLLQEAAHLVDLYRMNDYWQTNWNENSALLHHQLYYAAEMLNQIVRERSDKSLAKSPRLQYRLDYQRRQSPIFDQMICGDSVLCSEIGNYAVLAISDGMGSGVSANQESKSAIRLLERMLHLNYSPEQAMRTINTMLLARSAGERFATLDVLVVDLTSGEGDIYKSGAAPSFLLRDGLVHEIAGNGLPAGALPELAIEKRHLPLREHDLIVLISDGMLLMNDEQGPTAILTHILDQAKEDAPMHIAERLMLCVEGERNQEMLDDRTILIARVRKR